MSFAIPPALERTFFRRLNGVVEPAVRRGFGSPRWLPAGLLVLESTGFKSGLKRRTPLWSLRLGPYMLVATVRGERSFWVKNLVKRPAVRVWRGGQENRMRAYVMAPGKGFRRPRSLPAWLQDIAQRLQPLTQQGWAFAILSPQSPATNPS
ncbi:MAG: nitroreductase/quinone reductase family protein [Halieaceae bacterium]|jgi:deazaflavin-dependent oxidoreductase (nitroreductase family)|nr:nitroreductase/quinone reductase family protein [Halieaceae bacterium]